MQEQQLFEICPIGTTLNVLFLQAYSVTDVTTVPHRASENSTSTETKVKHNYVVIVCKAGVVFSANYLDVELTESWGEQELITGRAKK